MQRTYLHSAPQKELSNLGGKTENSIFPPLRIPYPKGEDCQQDSAKNEADVLILGAGASGLMCAREAAGRGLKVVILERGTVPGRKLAISGGGKANFTNRQINASYYRCAGVENSDFCAPALRSFTPAHMIRLVRHWQLPFEEREHGQLFLTVPAQKIVKALLEDCRQRGCHVECKKSVESLHVLGDFFEVKTTLEAWRAKNVVLALGSPAWPQAGGSGQGYRLAQSLGHSVVLPRPALSPLLLPAAHPFTELAGISLPVCISVGHRHWQDDLLFTHEGLSGPAALKASLYWEEGAEIRVDFLPAQKFKTLLDANESGKQTPRAILARLLPQRLVDALLPQENARRKAAELSRATRIVLEEAVHNHVLLPVGVAGLKKAEICLGGVSTCEVDPLTMGSLRTRGLYVIGELLDVAGLLGGYNLHWAWASGVAAARALSSETCHTPKA
ncbi:MAG: aminoacetone oxidase family FAD-binding enzyme [Desulfovibrio sp.]|uniref:NAD(P)/FAD-dependent oxidoreductase n=1 Tax=Desulfovibrio sp. TaxID=885 RepID=UPI0039E3EC7D